MIFLFNEDYKIEFANEQDFPFDPVPLTTAVGQILRDHGVARSEISIALVDDPAIRRLNKEYLDHDYETDVISFLLSEEKSSDSLCGQLIVSTDTAQNVARQIGGRWQDELLLYVIHGMLHLVGYDDKNQIDASEMRNQERDYLGRHGITHRWSQTDTHAFDVGAEGTGERPESFRANVNSSERDDLKHEQDTEDL